MIAQQIDEARSLASVVPQNITAVDTCPAFVIQYVPNLGSGGTSASITRATGEGAMTFLVDSAALGTADMIGTAGSAGVIPVGGYDTVGDFQDMVNAGSAWRMYLVGALRADDPTAILAQAIATCHGANGLTFYYDSSCTVGTNNSHMSIAVSGEKFSNNGVGGHFKDKADQCENSLFYGSFKATFGSGGAGTGTSATYSLKFYSGLQGTTETLLNSTALTQSTALEIGEENPSIPWITAKRGERLICRMVADSLWAVATTPDIVALGKSVVFKNNRVVTEDNY